MASTKPSTTTLPPPAIPKLTPQKQTDLSTLSSMLHLLHHRNKNQHRRSAWYRHFSLFRRHLILLLSHYDSLSHIPDTALAKHRKKTTDEATEAQIAAELVFWRDCLVPRCVHVFGQLVAEKRFAVIGVVLLGAVAQVSAAMGLVGVYEACAEEEVRRVLEEFGREWDGGGMMGDEGVRVARVDEDEGEVLRREGDEIVGEKKVEDEIIRERVRRNEDDCLSLEREVLRRSREALMGLSSRVAPGLEGSSATKKKKIERDLPDSKNVTSADVDVTPAAASQDVASPKPSFPKEKRAAKSTDATSSKPQKKKRKKNAIDELFSGL